MHTSIKKFSILLSALTLVACGSGSSGNNNTPVPAPTPSSSYQYDKIDITSSCAQGLDANNETIANITLKFSSVKPAAYIQISPATPVDPAISVSSAGNCSSDNESQEISCTYTFKFNDAIPIPTSKIKFQFNGALGSEDLILPAISMGDICTYINSH